MYGLIGFKPRISAQKLDHSMPQQGNAFCVMVSKC